MGQGFMANCRPFATTVTSLDRRRIFGPQSRRRAKTVAPTRTEPSRESAVGKPPSKSPRPMPDPDAVLP